MRSKAAVTCILVMSVFLSACGPGRLFGPTLTPTPTSTSTPTRTPYPTYTPFPTYTPYPTFTPFPTFTPTPTETSTPTFFPSPTGPSSTLALNVRARIDGVSYLVVQGNTVRWWHEAFTAPGRWIPASTYLNRVPWNPSWPDVPDSQNVDCRCYSSMYQGIPAVADNPPVDLEILQARGNVSITQQPDQGNAYTLVVKFDDVAPPDTYGDEWYEIRLTSNPIPTATPTPTNTPTVTATEKTSPPDSTPGLVLHFDGSFTGTGNEQGNPSEGLSFVSGHTGQGVLFDKENTLNYLTGNNISPQQGAIEFWLKPLWNGDDNQNYVFFEIGDSWFNRFLIIKDGANNLKFMLYSSKVEYGVACGVSGWKAHDWRYVKATWQKDRISLYLDGDLCGTQTFVTMPDSLSSRFYIGSSAQGNLQAQSVMDELIIHPQP